MYPTDVLKTRAQLSSKSVSMYQTFQSVVQEQGVGGLYRGIIAPIMAEAPKRAWKFSANEKFKQLFRLRNNGELTIATGAAAGSLAGLTETIVNCPFETVKVRMQSKEFLSKFKGTAECLAYLVKNEGISSVYKGFEAQAWRNCFWNGAYFGIIGYINLENAARADERENMTKGEKLFEKFYVGAFASSVGTLLNTPFDVAKSRMQLQSNEAGQLPKYRYAFQSIGLIAKEEGFSAIYKGLGPRLVRLGPGGGIMIVAFEFISGLLQNF